MLQDWLILNYSLETATQRNGLCFISSTATRHSVAMLQYLGGILLKENPASLNASSCLGCQQEAEYISWVGCLPPDAAEPEEGEDTTQQRLSLHHPTPEMTLCSHWGAEPCADGFHIPLCLSSHFLQKNWAHLAFKCVSGEAKWKVGFARWNFTTENLKNAGKSFERECGR